MLQKRLIHIKDFLTELIDQYDLPAELIEQIKTITDQPEQRHGPRDPNNSNISQDNSCLVP